MWIRVSLSSLLSSIHVLWGAAFRWRVPKSASFSTFETSLPQLPSYYSRVTTLHLALPPPSTRSPYLRALLPESVGSIYRWKLAWIQSVFRGDWSFYRREEDQTAVAWFSHLLLLLKTLKLLRQCNDKALNATSQREAVMILTQSSPKPAISRQFFHRRESRDPACYFRFIVATAWILLLLLLVCCGNTSESTFFSMSLGAPWVISGSQLFTLTTTTSTDKVSRPQMDTFISAPISPRIINTCLELLDN